MTYTKLWFFVFILSSLSGGRCSPDAERKSEVLLPVSDTKMMFNTAKAGLKIRSAPSLNSSVVAIVSYGDKVGLQETTGPEFESQGVRGRWGKVIYRDESNQSDKPGFAFTGYLSQTSDFLCLKVNDLANLPKFDAACMLFACENTGCPSDSILYGNGKAFVTGNCHHALHGKWYVENNSIVIEGIFRAAKNSIMYPTDCSQLCKDELCFQECKKTATITKTTIIYKRLTDLSFNKLTRRQTLDSNDQPNGTATEQDEGNIGCLRPFVGQRH